MGNKISNSLLNKLVQFLSWTHGARLPAMDWCSAFNSLKLFCFWGCSWCWSHTACWYWRLRACRLVRMDWKYFFRHLWLEFALDVWGFGLNISIIRLDILLLGSRQLSSHCSWLSYRTASLAVRVVNFRCLFFIARDLVLGVERICCSNRLDALLKTSRQSPVYVLIAGQVSRRVYSFVMWEIA